MTDPSDSMPSHPVPPDSRYDNQRWLRLWRDQQQSSFHQLAVNPLLSRFWQKLGLKRSHRVLVPLCGKSLDMLWLAEQGHEVVGIELSPIAVEAFFKERDLQAKKQRIGNFVRWRAKTISIWCGDFFALSSKQIGRIDAVFDRAALTALPPESRHAYVSKLMDLTEQGAPILLFTIEDIESDGGRESRSVDRELDDLCQGNYSVQLLHSEVIPQAEDQHRLVSHSKEYRLLRKSFTL